MTKNMILCLILAIMLAPLSIAQDDVDGSKDHPIISRYEESYIIGYEQVNYDQLNLPVGPYAGDDTKTVSPEGKVTRILYAAPRGKSSIEVQRNYQLALQNAGFQILYECSKDCEKLARIFYGYEQQLKNRGDLSRFAISYDRSKNQRYLLAEFHGPKGSLFASVFTVLSTGNYYSNKDKKEIENRPVTLLQIVEEQQMEKGKVQVNADAMAADLNKTGRVLLYGIYFDTDKASIKTSSVPTLIEIGTLLNKNSGLNLIVVGHTDATGGLQHNMDLSRRRAEAVVKYLVSDLGISSNRLEAHGVGYLAPVATNETENGRSLNRRVELIKDYD